MKTKWSLLAILALFLMSTQLTAQARGGSVEEKAEKATERMAKELDLTEDQEKLVLDANRKHITEMEAMRSSHEKQREQMRSIMKSHEELMKEILSPEQFESFKKLRKEHRRKMRHRRERMEEEHEERDLR